MAQQRTKYQQRIIKNYYDNRETISLQKLSEQVTELYLADGKKRQQVWKRIIAALEKLDVKQPQIDHLVKEDSPELVAKLVNQLMAKS